MPYLRPLQEYRVAAWPLDGPFFFLGAAVAAAIACAPRGRWRTFLPVIALGLLGARRIRFVAEFALLAAPAIAAAVSERLRRLGEQDGAGAARGAGSAASPIAAGVVAAALLVLAIAPRAADASAGRPVRRSRHRAGPGARARRSASPNGRACASACTTISRSART